MHYLIFLFFSLVAGATGNLLGREKCSWGPSYWCGNIGNSKECHATKHCIESTWSSMNFTQDDDDVCSVCKEMVKEARDQLLSNETQEELREVLIGSCDLIPLKPVSTECEKMVENYLPELVDALVSRMDPLAVCSVSGLCNNATIDQLLLPKPTPPRPCCSSCVFHTTKAFKVINSTHHLLPLCATLGSYSDSCIAQLTQYNRVPPELDAKEFCDLLGICGEQGEQGGCTKTDLPCDFCKQLVSTGKDWLMKNTTKEEFGVLVEQICKRFGGDECRKFFKEYGAGIYTLLEELDPEGTCERVGVCAEPQMIWSILQVDTPMVPLVAPIRVLPPTTTTQPPSTPECTLCTTIESALQTFLQDPQTTEQLEHFVDNLCDMYLPKELSSGCEDFIKDYGDQILELVESAVDVGKICERLRICVEAKVEWIDPLPTCSICEFTVTKLIDLIGKNRTKESIEEATQKLCEAMPKRYSESCEDFMKNYGDRVIEMILVEGTAHGICSALKLCLFRDEPRCVLCEYVLNTIDSRLKDNATEEEIKNEVLHICTKLPKTVQKKCQTFVNIYGDLVISYLADEMDPKAVCTELRLCKETHPLSSCELCHVIKNYLALDSSGSTLCERMTQKLECQEMLEDYGLYITRLLNEGDENVCSTIDVC